jgi:hypothetical protein
MVEAEQLLQMGELSEDDKSGAERHGPLPRWSRSASMSGIATIAANPETGAAAYHQYPRDMGVADSILPAALPMPAPGREAREKGILSVYDLANLTKTNGAATA